MTSLHRYLVSVAVFLVLLLCASAALLVYHVDRFGRSQSEQQLLGTTRALSLVVDGELKQYEAILLALKTSQHVERREWTGFDRVARTLLAGPNAWIIVSDRSGQQLVNTRLPAGSKLPAARLPSQLLSDLDRGRSRVCNLSRGLVEQNILCVDVPVMQGGRAEYFLSVVMRPEQLNGVMDQQRIPLGRFATVVDRNGIVVWRNTAAQRFIGRPATPDMRRAIETMSEGVVESRSLEGVPTVAAFNKSSFSGWTFIVAVPRTAMRAGTTRAFALAATVAALLLLTGSLVGFLAARRIARAVRSLARTAERANEIETPGFQSTGLAEIDAAGQALVEALRTRNLMEERYRRIFEQTSDLILTADLNQTITDCNPSAAEAVGLPREQAIGRKIADFVSEEDFGRTTEALRQKLTAGGTTRYDVRVRSSSGEWLSWEINSGLTYDRDGRPVELHVVGRDITERKKAEEHQRLLINELNHRVKNSLAVVQGIAHQTLRNSNAPPEVREALEGRLAALSRAHDVLTRENWTTASMREIIQDAVAPFCIDARCSVSGPDLRLPPKLSESLALAVHELATNASKYGALSNEAGRIVVEWTAVNEQLRLIWREENGPPVEQPSLRGFGTRMIERALAAELGGTATLSFEAAGLVCTIDAPVPQI